MAGAARMICMKQIEVAAAVIIRDGKVFCAQRPNKGEVALKWEFPGGKLESGERGEETVVREIREELLSVVNVEKDLGAITWQYRTFGIHMHAYRCRLMEGSLTLNEHVAAKWLDRNALRSVDWADADKLLLPAVETELKK